MKRILFVDDEPHLLEGLQRMLRLRRGEWDMEFALGGEEALLLLAERPFDAIVADAHMPNVDGAVLLQIVQRMYPAMVRIIFSGSAEIETAIRTIPIAHQYLAKPCDADSLREVVDRSCRLQALLQDKTLRKIVGEIKTLPSLPHVYAEITQELAKPEFSLMRVAKVIERDVGMCARVLQIVNSAFFGLPQKITDIQAAVNYLGTSTLKALVASTEAFRNLEEIGSVPGFSLERLQRHSIRTAHIAKRMFKDRRLAEESFMAGMLHEIGQIPLATRLPDHFSRVYAEFQRSGLSFHASELKVAGISHAEVGGYLLGIWGLPYSIVEAVAHHHEPRRVPQQSFGVLAALHVADGLAQEIEGEESMHEEIDLDFLRSLGVADKLPAWREIARENEADGESRV